MTQQIDQSLIHVVEATTYGIKAEEKSAEEFPYRLEVRLRSDAAALMFIANAEVFIAQGKTAEVLQQLNRLNRFDSHPRLERMTISGPQGIIEEAPQSNS